MIWKTKLLVQEMSTSVIDMIPFSGAGFSREVETRIGKNGTRCGSAMDENEDSVPTSL